ncbi:hypothetical protein WA158_005507 [Blastocystis sp. Blastoise]
MKYLIFVYFIIIFTVVDAWSCNYHKMIMDVAFLQLDQDKRDFYDALFQEDQDEYKSHANYRTAACWADYVKYKHIRDGKLFSGTFHFIDLHYPNDQIEYYENHQEKLRQYYASWKHLYGRIYTKRQFLDSLRMYIHIVSDLHQPLHVFELVNDDYPTGDKGGLKFKVLLPNRKQNKGVSLHKVYDDCGYFSKKDKDLSTPESLSELCDSDDLGIYSVPAFVQDVKRYAHDVYETLNPGEELSPSYIQTMRYNLHYQVCLAGKRLAFYFQEHYSEFINVMNILMTRNMTQFEYYYIDANLYEYSQFD